MSILQEILAWTQGLPAWQSDAVARLLAKQTLTMDDNEDLFALLKLAHGIPDPKGRQPKPLTADQIPAPVAVATHIELVAMKNMRNVNAIAENQRLPFNATGMTVIYGDNGSGKSGYSRVLKRACRARDRTEAIHPNAHLPAGQAGVPEATFEILVDGVAKDVQWTHGKVAPPELSSLAVFDTRCARAYLDSEDDFSYVPYGLDVFEALAKVCKQLKAMVEAEQMQSAADLTAFSPLQGDTLVGKLISSLSAKTTQAQIDALANLTAEELAQHAELEKSLQENNPKDKAAQLRLQASPCHNHRDKRDQQRRAGRPSRRRKAAQFGGQLSHSAGSSRACCQRIQGRRRSSAGHRGRGLARAVRRRSQVFRRVTSGQGVSRPRHRCTLSAMPAALGRRRYSLAAF